MSAAFTFGSVGDIITICQLVVQLSRALSSANGAVREYADLRRELDLFAQVLMQASLPARASWAHLASVYHTTNGKR
jgi:hypothetical protein